MFSRLTKRYEFLHICKIVSCVINWTINTFKKYSLSYQELWITSYHCNRAEWHIGVEIFLRVSIARKKEKRWQHNTTIIVDVHLFELIFNSTRHDAKEHKEIRKYSWKFQAWKFMRSRFAPQTSLPSNDVSHLYF